MARGMADFTEPYGQTRMAADGQARVQQGSAESFLLSFSK